MGINKKNIKLLFLSFLIAVMVSSGCGKNTDSEAGREKQPAEQGQQMTNTADEEKETGKSPDEEIPEELRPSGEPAVSPDVSEISEKTPEQTPGSQKDGAVFDMSAETGTSSYESSNKAGGSSGGNSSSKDKNTPGGKSEGSGQGTAESKTVQVKISVECKNAVAAGYGGSATILSAKTLTLEKGATVYDALAASGVSFSGGGGYISEIGGLGEFDYGSQSGWMYFVNGVKPNVGCTGYTCEDGDVIQWRYTTSLGNDL